MALAELKTVTTYVFTCPDHPFEAWSTTDKNLAEQNLSVHNQLLHLETEEPHG